MQLGRKGLVDGKLEKVGKNEISRRTNILPIERNAKQTQAFITIGTTK